MRWIKEDQWGQVLSGLAGVEASFPASLQLNEVSMSIQLRLFPRIITLSWLQTNPSLGVLVAEHCVPFSAGRWASGERLIKWRPWYEPVRVVAHVTPQSKALATACYAVTHGPATCQELWTKPKHHSAQREDGGGGSHKRLGSFCWNKFKFL